ncbi:MAG TPA: B12 lower ligand biosynthesis radical SAM protein BzaD [Nitrospirota bacterium]|nr:B12 lower ligand biosynthesis radical SAM protein BzaD [Nitrospirota bacterium]
MRVLFIQSPSVEGSSAEKVYPLGIVILAGLLRDRGDAVELVDTNIEPDPFGAIKNKILDFKPDVVGISLRNIDPLGNKTSSLVPPFLVIARLVRAVAPEAWIIAGGTAFSLFPARLMLEAPEIDYGLIGEAEASLPILLDSLENPTRVPGLCWRARDRITIEAPPACFNVAEYAPPARDVLDPTRYAGINAYVPAVGIELKRGCPFHCAYCVYPALQGRKLRMRTPQEVVDEMETLQKEYGIDRFHFTDPVVNYPEDPIQIVCREILRRKLKVRWDGFMREDHFSEKQATLFERAGCECFSFSPDGLCQESLDVLDKRLTEGDILKAVKAAAKTEVMSVYHFLVNVPGETDETSAKGVRMLERIYDFHGNKKNLGTIVLNNVRILPGTGIERLARVRGVIGPDTDLLYPTYYNPRPFDTFRYRLEALHLTRNVFMWQNVEESL